jgi:integrase
MRKSEVLNLRWTDIDFNRKELRIEDTKAGRPLYLPLSYQVMTLLDEITQQNEWVFPSTQKIGFSAKNIWRAWDSVRKLAGLEDVRIHDLRRTVGSWMAQEGADRHLIGKVLNQTSPEVTAIYARFADKQVRQVLQQHGDQISLIANVSSLSTG